jgi:integrase
LNPDGTLKATKTAAARTVALDATTVAVLKDWRTACRTRAFAVGAKIDADCYVVSDEPDSTRPWRPDLATKRFRWLAGQAGASGMRLHDVRHVVVSTLLTSGVPVHEVSQWIGHSRSSVTLDVYAHVFTDRTAGNAEIMRKALDG